jgi:predicted DNA-binding transcriptional regulator AlpA
MTLRLDELEAALGISRRLVQKEIAAGRFPRPIKIGRTSVWSVEALREHLAQQAAVGRRRS